MTIDWCNVSVSFCFYVKNDEEKKIQPKSKYWWFLLLLESEDSIHFLINHHSSLIHHSPHQILIKSIGVNQSEWRCFWLLEDSSLFWQMTICQPLWRISFSTFILRLITGINTSPFFFFKFETKEKKEQDAFSFQTKEQHERRRGDLSVPPLSHDRWMNESIRQHQQQH